MAYDLEHFEESLEDVFVFQDNDLLSMVLRERYKFTQKHPLIMMNGFIEVVGVSAIVVGSGVFTAVKEVKKRDLAATVGKPKRSMLKAHSS